MADIIDGKLLAAQIIEQIKHETGQLMASHNIRPGLAVVIVGEDPASEIYVSSKSRKAEECGFKSVTHKLDSDINEKDLLRLITNLNGDPAIHGILVQLPLPNHISAEKVIETISPRKDVDGFHYVNAGKLAIGAIDDTFVPCTPAGAMIMIRRVLGNDLSNLDAVIVGRSNIVGKPMASLLLAANATTTIAHSRTHDLQDVVRSGDIVVAAVGKPELIKGDWIKPGATVIDVGINRIDAPEKGEGKTRIVGDVEFDSASQVAGAITPVPGGVGPMTIAMLMANTLKAACLSVGVAAPQFD
ncbi:bifunctional methylenetetrahydrofolate dehydrogenase/methenyltetrahydrofolate cyclohydrolase [Bartonella sp. HY329]|uniref:bifunctional methylenetetrahydrofolate dehydrogenase/methenyltetrahydrofolate cyclohydrolase n=1 Tax=unclassified Bartonella TaxID=2645622 RepID=UPI0021C7F4FA|nr:MULTISPECIES: bifunctional methylenetetrahydrofolate dehydrogenase/methenyltetrahydrofolate cyclohydrolase [unclassified Bartonella]UXM95199.1 bifunctional methylenetetrahydrofolate dehydrogenase/methenyltetrahydrofolate cyclohydrolase [Bartonella sp. HY329]UXN09522.1 bifunctional methylenetetrahydrofolate dehydrogenase/methenyltetrahydrofolate cyclohydrolase [Bartonella sp. HY328]